MCIPCFASTLISQRYCEINDTADDKLPTIKLLGKPYTARSMMGDVGDGGWSGSLLPVI
jgi:hypothetical protein